MVESDVAMLNVIFEMRQKVLVAVATALLLLSTLPAVAGVQGSVHDFSANIWSAGEICTACHTPHNANGAVQVPLWNHEISTATYTLYSSSTLKISPVQLEPGNISRLCLSCHDGTIAVDSFGSRAGDQKIVGNPNLGTDLSDDHPVGIYWDHQTQVPGENDCLVCHSFYLLPGGWGYGMDLANAGNELKFYNHRIECPTCHDVHNTEVQDVKLLRKTRAGSAICLHCHPK
ncbi:MAG: cytochrome C [Candidatus Thiodiazotropha sp.]